MSTATVKKTTKTAATRATAQGSARRRTSAKKTTAKKATNKTKTAKATATRYIPTEHDIRQRAFELYLKSGCQPGRELKDWLQAEEELLKN